MTKSETTRAEDDLPRARRLVNGSRLYIRCNAPNSKRYLGVASVVRLNPIRIITAAHLLNQATLDECKPVFTDYALTRPCEFDIVETRYAQRKIAIYPIDIASAVLKPVGADECVVRQTLKFLFSEQRNGASQLRIRYLNFQPNVGNLDVTIEPISDEVMPELIVQRPDNANDPSKWFYGSYSGSPVIDVSREGGRQQIPVVGILTMRVGKGGETSDVGLPMALIQRLQDVMAFPEDVVDSVFSLVGPSPMAEGVAQALSGCSGASTAGAELVEKFDAFDQYFIIRYIQASVQCTRAQKRAIFDHVSDRMYDKLNVDQPVNLPSFSNASVSYSSRRKCSVSLAQPNGQVSQTNFAIVQNLYIHAMREIIQVPAALDSGTAKRLRRSFALAMYDRAACQAEAEGYLRRPQYVLSGLAQSVDSAPDMTRESLKLFAGLFAQIARDVLPSYKDGEPVCGNGASWKCNLEEGVRIRLAGISFKLQDLCYLAGECVGGDVIEAAAVLKTVLDSNHEGLITWMPDRNSQTGKFVNSLRFALTHSSAIYRDDPSDAFYIRAVESDLDYIDRACAYRILKMKKRRLICHRTKI